MSHITKPLSDDEATREMKKMVAFIMQEAAEKSRELQVKADEEFNIEKAKLVRQGTATIEQQYQKKLKQADVKRRIAQSVQINKARLQILQARDQVLDDVVEETKKHLRNISVDEKIYQEFLKNLILQGLFRLMDENITITCRVQDAALVEKSIDQAAMQFAKESGIRTSISLDSTYLAPDCAGGIIVSSLNGKIKCDNTLEMRMEQAFEMMLPTLRGRLFGQASNRKFFD